MPIYAYRCSECGHAKDVLQKMSDPVLSVCPACGTASFVKQVTAAGFQLKGSGWYVTDFKGGNAAPPPADGAKGEAEKGEPSKDAAKDGAKGDAAKGDAPKNDTAKPDAAPAPAAAPASKNDGRAAKPDSGAAAPATPTAPAPAPAPKGGAPAAGGG